MSYARQARRIRRAFRSAPNSRYLALRKLADSHDAMAAAPVTDRSAIQVFARLAQSQLTGPLLTYSARQALIARARQMGITRFDANLVIAAVVHNAPGGDAVAEVIDAVTRDDRRPAWGAWAGLLAATLVVQTGIVLAIWAMLA